MTPPEISGVGARSLPEHPARPLDDRELARQIRAGHAEAWDLFVDRYQRLVYSAALHDGLDPEDAIDVTQSTFMIFLESGSALRHEETLGSWLMTVARRQSWRVRQRHRWEGPRPQVTAETEPPTVDWEQIVSLHSALHKLANPCRDLVVALYFDPARPTYAQIARRMGRSVGSIGPMRGRCLHRLRGLLEDVWWT